MKIPIDPLPCPRCQRTMRAHCDNKCGWLFCGICDVILDRRTRKILGTFKGNGWKPE